MREFLRKLLVRLLEKIDGNQIPEWLAASARANGYCLDNADRARAETQTKCTHRKGGSYNRHSPFMNGNAAQYAVRKHVMMNRDLWVDCLRCGKKWRPPLRSEFRNDREFYKAVEEYETAKNFPTNNVTSSSILLMFHDKTGKCADSQITKMYAAIGA